MSILCVWTPVWQTGEASPAEQVPVILEEAPRVAVEAERGIVWVDVRGMPGEAVARRVVGRLEEAGVEGVRAGMAATPIVAEAAARHGGGGVRVVGRGDEGDFLGRCPLDLLTDDPRLLAMLEGVGVRRCGDLAALTAEAAEVRFGAEGTRLWRLSRADDPRILFRSIPAERPHASVDFLDYTVRDATRLVFTLNALLDQVCEEMRTRSRRARSLTLTFELGSGARVDEVIRTARPTSDRTLWIRRIRALLERVKLPDGIAGVALTAGTLEPLSALQGDLFDRGFATASFVEEAVGRLMDMYRGLFTRQSDSSHPLAERRTAWIDLTPEEAAATVGGHASHDHAAPPSLHLQLLAEPRPIRVATHDRRDHSCPVRYQEGKQWHTLQSAGPDRISGGHEEARPYAREYYRCVSDEGSLLWIYRDAVKDSWYLHGWWD